MTYSDYALSPNEFITYKAAKKCWKLDLIWEDLIKRIEPNDLKKEAKKKGYVLIDNPDLEDDVIAEYKMFSIPNATKELTNYFRENLYPFVVCLKNS